MTDDKHNPEADEQEITPPVKIDEDEQTIDVKASAEQDTQHDSEDDDELDIPEELPIL